MGKRNPRAKPRVLKNWDIKNRGVPKNWDFPKNGTEKLGRPEKLGYPNKLGEKKTGHLGCRIPGEHTVTTGRSESETRTVGNRTVGNQTDLTDLTDLKLGTKPTFAFRFPCLRPFLFFPSQKSTTSALPA